MNTEALQIAKLEGEVEALKGVIADLVKQLAERPPVDEQKAYGPECTVDDDLVYRTTISGAVLYNMDGTVAAVNYCNGGSCHTPSK